MHLQTQELVSSHRAWYADNLNVCSPLIIPFTTSIYWIIHLHTSDWDQQQEGLVCGCTSLSLGWGLITFVCWVGIKHELEVELNSWRCNAKAKRMLEGLESCKTVSCRLFCLTSLPLLYTFYLDFNAEDIFESQIYITSK